MSGHVIEPTKLLRQMETIVETKMGKTLGKQLLGHIKNSTRKKHSCQNGLKLLPAQFFLLFEQDFLTEIAGKPLFLLLELKNPAQIAGKIELEVISSHFGRNVFSVKTHLIEASDFCNRFLSNVIICNGGWLKVYKPHKIF